MPIDPHQFARDEGGAVAVIVSLLLTVLIGFTALGVDVASLYRDRAQLQGVSDLAAVSAVAAHDIAAERARHTMARNPSSAPTLRTIETGRFLRNPAVPRQDRFTPLPADTPGINAVRVVLEEDAPLHFAVVFSDKTHVALDRTALATRTGGASFSLDSRIAHLDLAALDALLMQEFGVGAAIGVGGLQVLGSTSISLGALTGALRETLGDTARNPAEILERTVDLADLLVALQSILPPAAAQTLQGLADGAGTTVISVASIVGGIDVDLGLTATEFLSQIDVSALEIVQAIAAVHQGATGTVVSAGAGVPGVLGVTTTLHAGEPPAQSGWVALGEEGVQLNRAAARLTTDLQLAPALLGSLGVGVEVTSLEVPLHVELAGATATLTKVSCNTSSPQGVAAQFATAHTPLHPNNGTSVAALYLGEIPPGPGPIAPADVGFADLLSLNIVVPLPLLNLVIPGLTIQARSTTRVGASQAQSVSFTHADVANANTVKTFGSGALLSSAVGDLLSPANTELRIKPGQAGLISALAAPVVNGVLAALPSALLTGLTAPVDAVLDATLASLGVQLGAGELTLTGHHCEPIRLVR
ncbi:pilus assembly protein TadG-related protein [Thalassorhabdomicrobium marinisediminis]|uniref:pilus assembly protein TadG-related protein n=1 Tax=Thalassorhabdomicrobium marinisediminis TaxID=2170577 RepID=UPI002492B133|nr:pilus assembly protein TadG-related protein [Thalassorhabdomicrobium marinisediminis]